MKGISLGIDPIAAGPQCAAMEARLAEIRGWGYDAVEPLIGLPDAGVLAELGPMLSRTGLALSGFRTGTLYRVHGYSFSDPDPAVRRAAVDAIKAVIRETARFPGAKVYNGMIQGKPKPGVGIGEAKARCEEALRECLREAERLGVGFCLEALNRYDVPYHNTLAEVADLVRRIGSPKLSILADTFHMNIEEHDLCAAIRAHAPLIGGVHFIDSTRREPGSGHLDLHAVYGTLREIGYAGYVTVEMNGHPDYDGIARKTAVFLRGLRKEFDAR
jgi:5-keto-L-gluconate epimerase